MKQPRAPGLDARRADDFESELVARARAWIPAWALDDDSRDFGRALFKVAARFASEVAERLDRGGDRMRLGFLDWLAFEGEAARPSRLPVVFKLADSARAAVPGPEGARLQVEVQGAAVILETEKGVNVLPGQLQTLVAVDADNDQFYLAPPGLSSLAPLEPVPMQWRLKSFASADTTRVQVDPETGLVKDMLVELGGLQYRITKVDKDIVDLDPPLTREQAEQSVMKLVSAFAPFDGAARNRQEHALYLGHTELLDIEAPATIEVVGVKQLTPGVSWQYWGKKHDSKDVGWQSLLPADAAEQVRADAVILSKPKGSMEQVPIKDRNSRWIRARLDTITGNDPLLTVDRIELCVSSQPVVSPADATEPSSAGPSAEAMANTTPIVLDSVFFPFGKEPRQFDAFYLGSKEAFSKKGADVTLKFEMADATFATLSAVREGAFAGRVLAGVARDGALHLLEVDPLKGLITPLLQREPLRPPPPEQDAQTMPGIALDSQPAWPLPVWYDDDGSFFVATTAGRAVWVWREHASDHKQSKWLRYGTLPTTAVTPEKPISGLVYLQGAIAADSPLLALGGGQLFKTFDGATWDPVITTPAVEFDTIVPVIDISSLTTSDTHGMVGVSHGNLLYHVTSGGDCEQLMGAGDVSVEVRPVAIMSGVQRLVAFTQSARHKLITLYPGGDTSEIPLTPTEQVRGLSVTTDGTRVYFLASVQSSLAGDLVSWIPPAPATKPIELFHTTIPPAVGVPDGVPVTLGQRVIVAAAGGDLLAAEFNLGNRRQFQSAVGEGIVMPASARALQPNDLVVRDAPTPPFERRTVAGPGTLSQNEIFYPLDHRLSDGKVGALFAFHSADASYSGNTQDPDILQLSDEDHVTAEGSFVEIEGVAHRVIHLETTALGRQATLEPGHDDTESVTYKVGVPIAARAAPFMLLNGTNNDWQAGMLEHASLVFPDAKPDAQSARAFTIDSSGRPLLVVMNSHWAKAPAAIAAFVFDAAVGSWARSAGDTSPNPELSWEYWNGTGWWKLTLDSDDTLRLKKSGELKFEVPLDLSPTDWSGRTNYWIRARLIGGDYGREKVTVATPPPGEDGVTHQTVERSTKDIHAPAVLKLAVSYEISKSVLPTFVLTQDSGSLRDQSDANRTAGALVEAFVPVSVLLGGLSDAATAPSSTQARASGRALYLGFDARLSGAPVNVLLLVKEQRNHDEFAPLTIEALVADRFVPTVNRDATRALGESGLLTLAFTLEPTPRELFGQTLSWLRLMPRAGTAAEEWKPTVRGAYLNAVWASAAETLTYELLGSSQGEPNLTVFLARPPVLLNTLELRVREPLGEEERRALNAEGNERVVSAVPNLPGDWVLWQRVVDTDDAEPTERMYSLDDGTGEIRFGDGRHGKIPPVGRDSIMAFKYRRTEAGASESLDVPGNAIDARTSLNLISPIETVEAVFAADHAAGGAPAENAEHVLRFGVARLRHRKRVVTPSDLEDLALASSPDIAQARCFPGNGFVRLVVVMRGPNPTPDAAQVRELSSLLLGKSPPSLSAPRVLRIGGAAVRRLRVDLRLRVASLDDAGDIAREAKNQVTALFDTVSGGLDRNGWALGENPTEADIAMVLATVPKLESIAGIDLREVTPNGSERSWPSDLKRNELAMLGDEVIRVAFTTVEVIA